MMADTPSTNTGELQHQDPLTPDPAPHRAGSLLAVLALGLLLGWGGATIRRDRPDGPFASPPDAAAAQGAGAAQAAAARPHRHEYAPIQAFRLDSALATSPEEAAHLRSLDDFRGIDLDGNPVEPLQLISENRVVLFTWFAEWCYNCRYEAPELVRIEERWADAGFAAVARSEYSHPDVVREFREEFEIEYPILLGSANPDPENEDGVRIATEHYRFRNALGDARKWGTPLSLLVVDGDIEAPYVVLGEVIPSVLERFLEDHLGPRVTSSSGVRPPGHP